MADEQTREDLREWLRQGDPAGDGAELPADELQCMRRRILSAAHEPARRRLVPLAALTATAALTAVLLLLRTEPVPLPDRGTPVRSAGAASSARVPRQIQFTTDRGTRILWTLDPDFEL